MKRWLIVLTSLVLSACGGGGGVSIYISTIEPDRLSYGQQTIFKVSGAGLSQKFEVTTGKCSGLALVEGGTDSTQTVSCMISGTGDLTFDVRDSNGVLLLSKKFTVPEPQVTMVTSMGTLVLELYPTAVPLTVQNFLQYVHDGFYTNTLIHHVVPNLLVHGGWITPAPAVIPGLRAPIPLETNRGLRNLRGSIAMSRKATADSATSQYFFNLIDNPSLDYISASSPGYAVFGRVVQGLEVMDAMGGVPTTTRYGIADFPVTDIVLQSAAQTR